MNRLEALVARHDLRDLERAVAKRRAQEERRLARLVAQRRKLHKELTKVERELKRASERAKKGARVARRPNARRLNDISLGDAIEKVLCGRKTPMHYKDLTEATVKRGLYRTRSKNLLSTVAVTLKRDRRFRKVEPGYYALR